MSRLTLAAVIANGALVAMAFALPLLFVRREDGMAGAALATLLFGTPMATALGVGIFAAVKAWLEARQRGHSPSWTGLLPLTIFGFGILLLAAWARTLN
jgi:ABC-type Mn2+/Zn2+ transport system permease subunit